MGHEDETLECNRTSGGGSAGAGAGAGRRGVGRPNKKPKPKKVPQRGLGVAQLEKIRLEEEQKEKEAAAATTAAVAETTAIASSTNSPYDMHLQFLNFHHSNQPSSQNPLPSSTVSFANSGGSDAFLHDVPVLGHVSRPHEFGFGKKNFDIDPGLNFASSLTFESNPIRPLSNWVQRTHQPSSSRTSVSLGTSSTTMSQFSIEPPSNQNYRENDVSMKKNEKMIGIKRPNPFSWDTPPVCSSNFKPLTFATPKRTSETISCGNGKGINLDFGNSSLREVPSHSASNSELISKKSKKGNKNFDRDFLKLAPPPQCSCSRLKSHSTFTPFHYQGKMQAKVRSPPEHNRFNQQQQHYFNFFPPSTNVAQITQQSDRFQNPNVVEENIDLDLKL